MKTFSDNFSARTGQLKCKEKIFKEQNAWEKKLDFIPFSDIFYDIWLQLCLSRLGMNFLQISLYSFLRFIIFYMYSIWLF